MRLAFVAAFICAFSASSACAQGSDPILAKIDPKASVALGPTAATHAPGSCHIREAANGMPLPDPACTPGAVNPTLTLDVLTDPHFRTGLVRDKITSKDRKKIVYIWYGITPPKNNTRQNQTCELDHAVDLAAGGADTLDNVWPQCQRAEDPPVPVGQRWFKIKDAYAEHAVIRQVKTGDVDLLSLQNRVAADWTQFLPTGH